MEEKEVLAIREQVRKAVLSLGALLEKAEAIGICGSLARGYDFTERSDIDLFVIVQDGKADEETDRLWWEWLSKALKPLGRDVTVFTYTVESLRRISNWYVLRLASEGILFYDKGYVKELFEQIVARARQLGLIEVEVRGRRFWKIPHLKLGEIVEIKLE